MASYIQIVPTSDDSDCNPTPQQRAVYSFYESRHSSEADDIYSPEWYERSKRFLKQFTAKEQDAIPTTLRTWDMVEDLDFGAFFLAHPIAAFSLWHVLQACYELDRAVCGTSEEALSTLEGWKSLKPFVYLRSKKVRVKWSKALRLMKKEIECGALEGEALVLRLYDILCGVERLESAAAAMKANFEVNLTGLKFVDKMLETVGRAVDGKCQVISESLRLEDDERVNENENEGSNDEFLGDSAHSSLTAAPANGSVEGELCPETRSSSIQQLCLEFSNSYVAHEGLSLLFVLLCAFPIIVGVWALWRRDRAEY